MTRGIRVPSSLETRKNPKPGRPSITQGVIRCLVCRDQSGLAQESIGYWGKESTSIRSVDSCLTSPVEGQTTFGPIPTDKLRACTSEHAPKPCSATSPLDILARMSNRTNVLRLHVPFSGITENYSRSLSDSMAQSWWLPHRKHKRKNDGHMPYFLAPIT